MLNAQKNGNLYVKSFFAASVPAAMDQAQRELGADALLLNSREAPPEARHLGQYEVVFGTWPETVIPAQSGAPPASRLDELSHRIHELRSMIVNMRPAARSAAGDDMGVVQVLVEAGLDCELASAIDRGARRRMSKGAVLDIARTRSVPDLRSATIDLRSATIDLRSATIDLRSATIDELDSRFDVQPEIGRITALVGPPGSGKTTTLVKLAVNQCLKLGRPVRLISTDNLRIGGADQLRTYAAILGVPFQTVESSVALAQAVDSAPANTWVLIDTPGFGPALLQELGSDLAAFLSRRQDIDTHLVLTATLDRAERAGTTDRFARFNPGKLIFTRLDETTSTATIFSEAVRTQKPLSFLSHGQAVPEDIVPAVKDLVIDSLVRQLPESLQAVA